MAAASSGVKEDLDWVQILLRDFSIVSLTKDQFLNLLQAVSRSESDILSHSKEPTNEPYPALVVLTADYIIGNLWAVPRDYLPLLINVCHILLDYLVTYIQTNVVNPSPTTNASSNVNPKHLLQAIHALCRAKRFLIPSEFKSLSVGVEMLSTTIKKRAETDAGDKSPTKDRVKRAPDLTKSIFEHLTTPLIDIAGQITFQTASDDNTDNAKTEIDESYVNEVQRILIAKNVEALQDMRGNEAIIDACLTFPSIKRFRVKYEETIAKKAYLAPTHADVQAFKNTLPACVSELSVVFDAISLPILEPLTSTKLDKLSLLCGACLYAALWCSSSISIVTSITSSSSTSNVSARTNSNTYNITSSASVVNISANKDDDLDSLAIQLVERSLQLFDHVMHVISASTRAGGHILQNHILLGAWLLINGLQAQLQTTTTTTERVVARDEKGRSPSRARDPTTRFNMLRVQQNFGVLSVALATKAIHLMDSILEDLHMECSTKASPSAIEFAPLNISAESTALQRTARLLNAAPVNQMLYYLATISYRKACTLKNMLRNAPEGDTYSQSDSTTYYEDMISCSTDDEDSEPILGQWFEETIALPEINETEPRDDGERNDNEPNARVNSIVPDKTEPNGFLTLATTIFRFMNKNFLCAKSDYLQKYVKCGLSEQQIALLAAIVRDLDREASKADLGTIAIVSKSCIPMASMYCLFSRALVRFTHNLITRDILSAGTQVALLNHLSISPWMTDANATWPLQVYPRALVVLTQILLTKPQQEKETACINIWQRLINTLVDCIANPSSTVDTDYEDLNVEHAQVLLYLFHALNLMQKKSILLQLATAIIRASKVTRTNCTATITKSTKANLLASAKKDTDEKDESELDKTGEYVRRMQFIDDARDLERLNDTLSVMNQSPSLTDNQLLHLSRLLLLFEYAIRHLYDAPSSLLEHLYWNLFISTGLITRDEDKDPANLQTRLFSMIIHCESFATNYRQNCQQSEWSMKPRFYTLAEIDKTDEKASKLDGLAYSFLLSNPDKLVYAELIDALLDVLNVSNISVGLNNTKITYQGLCATQYVYTICWRTLETLPLSVTYAQKLANPDTIVLPSPLMLYSLIWCPRVVSYHRWLKDGFVKQGMSASDADKLLSDLKATTSSSLQYDIGLAKRCAVFLKPHVDRAKYASTLDRSFLLSQLLLIDAVMAKVQISLLNEEDKLADSPENKTHVSAMNAEAVEGLLPSLLDLAQAILLDICSSLENEIIETYTSGANGSTDARNAITAEEFAVFNHILAILSPEHPLDDEFATKLMQSIPAFAKTILTKWKECTFPDCIWTPYLNDPIPSQNLILAIMDTHISTLSANVTFTTNVSLKRTLFVIVKFIAQHIARNAPQTLKTNAINLFIPLVFDVRTHYLHELSWRTLDKVIDMSQCSPEYRKLLYFYFLENTHKMLVKYCHLIDRSTLLPVLIDENILTGILAFLDKLMESTLVANASHLMALEDVLSSENNLLNSLMSLCGAATPHEYSKLLLDFILSLFWHGRFRNSKFTALTLQNFFAIETDKLQNWMRHLTLGNNFNAGDSVTSSVVQTPTIMTKDLTSPSGVTPSKFSLPDDVASTLAVAAANDGVATTSSVQSPSQMQKFISDMKRYIYHLQDLPQFIELEKSPRGQEARLAMLKTLIQITTKPILQPASGLDGYGFEELFPFMIALADTSTGHQHLFPAALQWLNVCKQYVVQKETFETTDEDSKILDCACDILAYIGDILMAINPQTVANAGLHSRAVSPPWDNGLNSDFDFNGFGSIDGDDDSGDEDSDEDSLNNKLCTFTLTQKEFMNQHWYHCHTCKMLDSVGVCSVCAKVCHKGHDVTYAKFGSFFCDCGDVINGSCKALVKRTSDTRAKDTKEKTLTTTTTTSAQTAKRDPSPNPLEKLVTNKDKKRIMQLSEIIEPIKDQILACIQPSALLSSLVDVANTLLPAIEKASLIYSPVGCLQRAQKALDDLHTKTKTYVDGNFMQTTLSSQEGAFENVRISYTGDQAANIRQLVSAHIIRRVTMCTTYNPITRRQHLIVAHEKGNITVLQLSSLLKQSDVTKRKLTLTRLAISGIPFTVLSLAANPCNDEVLAVCGLRDCHVLTMGTNGFVTEHLVLQQQLETGNYIIRAIWLPGAQTQLAVITGDFVKIYDLSKDAISPQYFYLVPSGKVRDCTFMHVDGTYQIIMISSTGHIYYQELDEQSSAQHGSFYVTNTLEIANMDVNEVNGQIGGGGASIYYSHTLQLLFFSYYAGRSFCAPLKTMVDTLPIIFPIQLNLNVDTNQAPTSATNPSSVSTSTTTVSSTNAVASSTSSLAVGTKPAQKSTQQPLCQWSEIPGHPGLVCCMMQHSNATIVLMVQPETISIQEIKTASKSKITDVVALRHPAYNANETVTDELRTSIITLSEDGSLRIHVADMNQTDFWLSPSIQPVVKTQKPRRKNKQKTNSKAIPIDFFESCQPMNDVEYSSNELLHVYTPTQLTARLNAPNLYVSIYRFGGYSITITNNDESMVMCGVRVLLGAQEVTRAPQSIEIFDRTIDTRQLQRGRWFDIPFTVEECLQAEKNVTIKFDSSADADSVTIVDTIKVYGKTKQSFGWTNDSEVAQATTITTTSCNSESKTPTIAASTKRGNVQATLLDKVIANVIEVLDIGFSLFGNADENIASQKLQALDLACKLLTLPLPYVAQLYTKALLIALHPTRSQYHNFVDEVTIRFVIKSLDDMLDVVKRTSASYVDPQNYYRLVLMVRAIAVSRPHNLVKYAELYAGSFKKTSVTSYTFSHVLVEKMYELLWALHKVRIKNVMLASVVPLGLSHPDVIVPALVEITHAYMIVYSQQENMGVLAANFYVQMLLSKDVMISATAKQAIIKVLKPKLPAVKRRSTKPHQPEPSTSHPEQNNSNSNTNPEAGATSDSLQNMLQLSEGSLREVDRIVAMFQNQNEEPDDDAARDLHSSSFEQLLGNAMATGAFRQFADLPEDSDDDTMVELAIALSLQEQGEGGGARDNMWLRPRGSASRGIRGRGRTRNVVGHSDQPYRRRQRNDRPGPSNSVNDGQSDDDGARGGTEMPYCGRGVVQRGSRSNDGGASSHSAEDGQLASSNNATVGQSGNGYDQPGTSNNSAFIDVVEEVEETGSSNADTSTSTSTWQHKPVEESQVSAAKTDVVPSSSSSKLTDADPSNENIDVETDVETASDIALLQSLRLRILKSFTRGHLMGLNKLSGIRVIPLMQVVLVLTTDLHLCGDKGVECLDELIEVLLMLLNINNANLNEIYKRTEQREVHLIILRLLTILMSRLKVVQPLRGAKHNVNSSLVMQKTATLLQEHRFIDYCLKIVQNLIPYWRAQTCENQSSDHACTTNVRKTNVGNSLLRERYPESTMDLQPFILSAYLKENATDPFENYAAVLTETVMRLPYHIQRHALQSLSVLRSFDAAWFKFLCEYMMLYQPPFVRRQARKLLLHICGSKEKYRQLRDVHAIESHMLQVEECCVAAGIDVNNKIGSHPLTLPYDSLWQFHDHFKACIEIASVRNCNWQRYCSHHKSTLAFLMRISYLLDEAISLTILQLLLSAIAPDVILNKKSSESKVDAKKDASKASTAATTQTAAWTAPTNQPSTSYASVASKSSTSSSKSKSKSKDREKSEESTSSGSDDANKIDTQTCRLLVAQIFTQLSLDDLASFIKAFLLDANSQSIRWQAHSFINAMFKHSTPENQEAILLIFWKIWPQLPTCGRKAAQFVDLLGHLSLTIHDSKDRCQSYIQQALEVLIFQNQVVENHPNANIYSNLRKYVEMTGYYLESDPCLVCNDPEIPPSTIKLTSSKADSKYTTTTHIMKLSGSHTINRINLRMTEQKRSKMVRAINIYYNNRHVQAVVELKNKPALWHKAKRIHLLPGQHDLKIEFPLPIVACNIMIEYDDFYENLQASSEILQCPRCSSNVAASPGVCNNCGENVYQCLKCRAINYDEKDPFLCNACGYCKYAKFEYSMLARPCCVVEPIEDDEDRKKMITTINGLLERADRLYKQLVVNKPTLEFYLLRINESRVSDNFELPEEFLTSTVVPASSVATQPANTHINKGIQHLAQRYAGDCKSAFEELSKIIRQILYCRKELVAYDRKQREGQQTQAPRLMRSSFIATESSNLNASDASVKPKTKCYGCAIAAVEHCLTLLTALATSQQMRVILCEKGLINELVTNNLRKGSSTIQKLTRHLLCELTKNNSDTTKELCKLLMKHIMQALFSSTIALVDFAEGVRYEVQLLVTLMQTDDMYWETKLRAIATLLFASCKFTNHPQVMDSITLPCLKIVLCLLDYRLFNKKHRKEEKPHSSSQNQTSQSKPSTSNTAPVRKSRSYTSIPVDFNKWLMAMPTENYSGWTKKYKARHAADKSKSCKGKTKAEQRARYLTEKYARKWREFVERKQSGQFVVNVLAREDWIKLIMFNTHSRIARAFMVSILESICDQGYERKKQVLLLLTRYLNELRSCGENAAEYLTIYQDLLNDWQWKRFLAVRGVLKQIASLIMSEIEELYRLEETTLTSDLAQGFALRQLTGLLALFLDDPEIRRQYKGRLVGTVLNGYLSLRRLVVQRTKLVDLTQEKLLELLEDMTSGTEDETKAFMAVCIETVQKFSKDDVRTPVFIFERLCSIISPEENDVGDFLLLLDKDAQQEDFLQGRMLGNPYHSTEAGLGPLMRDVKNKICHDCELIALLEDDNGMELLVHNKIISLDLPVKEVYKKIWLAEGGEDAMRVMYRMRGLLGDATEEFIETLDTQSPEVVDNEQVYKMANVLADCNGLTVMLDRLAAIQSVSYARPLLQVLLKLFRLCVKVKRNTELLIRPDMMAILPFLTTLQKCLDEINNSASDASQTCAIIEQLLEIMDTLLSCAASQSLHAYVEFSKTFGDVWFISSLLSYNTVNLRTNQMVLNYYTSVLAALTYGNTERMTILYDYFKPVLDFNLFDVEKHRIDVEQHKMEMFTVLCAGIRRNAVGNTLKEHIIESGTVQNAIDYITAHAPCIKPTLLKIDSDELKEFIQRPALKYILRFLTGLATEHEPTQLALSDIIPIVHRLEQISSDEHVGSLAENLLEALVTCAQVSKRVQEAREYTRAEKKRMAMAMREKQLGALGMCTNEKGQVTARSAVLQQMEELCEDDGLICCICREGYRYAPSQILAIYTFSKRCPVEEYEIGKPRRTYGFSTVTHFNVVHVECHMSAVRLARSRDEWDSAALQNTNTKCNGLVPIWGPGVLESCFAGSLARHNTYLKEATAHRDISHVYTIHDLKLLLLRFAHEKPFHEDTGGGGPQSNMHFIPYLMHMALYVINTTRSDLSEDKSITQYFEVTATDKILNSAYEVDGPLYWTTMCPLIVGRKRWKRRRIVHLKRLLIIAHVRKEQPVGPCTELTDRVQKSYDVYKPYLMFFGLIDGIYKYFLKGVPVVNDYSLWSKAVAEYIRYFDEALLKASEQLLAYYREELLPCTSFMEFCDVLGLLDEIPNPNSYIDEILAEL